MNGGGNYHVSLFSPGQEIVIGVLIVVLVLRAKRTRDEAGDDMNQGNAANLDKGPLSVQRDFDRIERAKQVRTVDEDPRQQK